jgi:hypothetical protein
MGLDMYLEGRKYLWNHMGDSPDIREEDGRRIKQVTLELGYWRKHPNLHGFIVQTFRDGEDDCRPIELDRDNVEAIMDAIKSRQLPKTEGFFFGESIGDEDEMQQDLKIFEDALKWLDEGEEESVKKREMRTLCYEASW